MRAWLETTGVAGQRLRFPLDRACLRVGSVGTSDVWIPLPEVRRTHCRIEAEAGGWRVRPVSGVEIHVNDRPSGGETALEVGDRLRIGRLEFLVREDAVEIEVGRIPPATAATPVPDETH